jgi:hypothetical protein
MKFLLPLLLIVLLCSAPAYSTETKTFPLVVRGKTISLGTKSNYQTVSASFKTILSPNDESLTSPESIQYDFIAVEGEGPLTLSLDFDADGLLESAIIESDVKEQNPVVQELVAWLKKHAGEGKKQEDETLWMYAGFLFHLREVVGAGEDSVYGMTIEKE